MNFFKDILKNSKDKKGKELIGWFALLLIGIMLLFFSTMTSNNKKESKTLSSLSNENIVSNEVSYEENMEKRLEEILSKVNGAGKVEVMLTISYGKEIVVADDISVDKQNSEEKDSEGGTRVNQNYSEQKSIVTYTPQSGKTEPVVLKEIEPKVEGIIIIAQGGDNILVESNLRKAATALFDVSAHKVEVFKMQ